MCSGTQVLARDFACARSGQVANGSLPNISGAFGRQLSCKLVVKYWSQTSRLSEKHLGMKVQPIRLAHVNTDANEFREHGADLVSIPLVPLLS